MTTTIADQRVRLAELLDTPVPVQHKAIAAEATLAREGTFEAMVASFDTLDRMGDVIRPGAFAKSLERWRQSGKHPRGLVPPERRPASRGRQRRPP